MEVELMNSSSPQNHLEMMEMMMTQLNSNKQPSSLFSRPYQDIIIPETSDLLEFSYSSGSVRTETCTAAPSTMFQKHPYHQISSSCNNGVSCMQIKRKPSMEAMREMIFRIAVMQPINIDPESVKPPKRKNVRISKDPQSVAARQRRERISERIRILQRLVPGGTKMDTASMLDEAVHYLKFLKKQVQTLERASSSSSSAASCDNNSTTLLRTAKNYSGLPVKFCQPSHYMMGSARSASMQMLS